MIMATIERELLLNHFMKNVTFIIIPSSKLLYKRSNLEKKIWKKKFRFFLANVTSRVSMGSLKNYLVKPFDQHKLTYIYIQGVSKKTVQ